MCLCESCIRDEIRAIAASEKVRKGLEFLFYDVREEESDLSE